MEPAELDAAAAPASGAEEARSVEPHCSNLPHSTSVLTALLVNVAPCVCSSCSTYLQGSQHLHGECLRPLSVNVADEHETATLS